MNFDVNFDAAVEPLVYHTGLGSAHCDTMRSLAQGFAASPEAWAAFKAQVDGPPRGARGTTSEEAARELAKALYVVADPVCAARCHEKIKRAIWVAEAEGWTMALQSVTALEGSGIDGAYKMGVRLAKQRLEKGAEVMWTGRA